VVVVDGDGDGGVVRALKCCHLFADRRPRAVAWCGMVWRGVAWWGISVAVVVCGAGIAACG
jgi:hypothetical protein